MSSSLVEINRQTGVIRVEGTEDFIWKVLDRLEHLLANEGAAAQAMHENASPAATHKTTSTSAASPESLYDHVFAEQNDKLRIIAHVDEGNKADTARKLVLIYLFGAELRGKEAADSEEIRALCESHGCYDSSNFSHYMRGLKNRVLTDGTSRKYTMRLTAPGRREAKQIVEDIQGASRG